MNVGVTLLWDVDDVIISGDLPVSTVDTWRREMLGHPSAEDPRMVCVGTLTVGRDEQVRRLVLMLYLGVAQG